MSDFDLEPLLRAEKDPLTREVLGAGKEEGPPSGARGRALAALGLSGATSTTVPRAAAPAQTSVVTRLRETLGMKGAIGLAGIAALGALTAFVAASADRAPPSEPPRRDEPADHAPPSAPENVVAPEKVTAPIVVTPESLPPSSEASVRPHATTPRSAAPTIPSAKIATATSTLGRETELVDAAGLALSRGLPDEALRHLDAYSHEFPSGAFALEVSVLRIEALARAGRAAEADRLAGDFLARHPTGPHARRVQAAQSHR